MCKIGLKIRQISSVSMYGTIELNVQRLHFCFLYPPILFRTVVVYIRVKLLFLFLNVQRLCFCFLYPPILFRTMVAYIRVKVLFLYLNVQRLRFCLSLSTHFFPHSECMYTVQYCTIGFRSYLLAKCAEIALLPFSIPHHSFLQNF